MTSPWRWIIVACYAVSLPFMRWVWDAVRSESAALANALPLAAAGVLIASLIAYLALVKKERRFPVYLSLVAVCLTYGFVFRSLPQPIEKVHLAQYGLLSMLVFWALAAGGGSPLLCLWAAAITVELGIADECVQGLLPARFYDFRDIVLNAKSALLGQAVVAFVLRPWDRRRPPAAPAALRQPTTKLTLWLALALVIGLTAMNIYLIELGTPTIVENAQRGDGALRHRDGFIHFGPAAVALNAAVVLGSLLMVRIYGRTSGTGRPLRAAIICGLLPPLVLIAGKLADFRFR